MKFIVVFVTFAVLALAEKEAPYPPSGWKPDGPQLTYPPPTPSNEYGPAPTSPPSNEYGPAPTEPPTTESPQEPPPTYVPSEDNSNPSNGGYSRYQTQRSNSRASAQLNQGSGQFFIITPQGQLQHIPIVVPQANNRDVEPIEPQTGDGRAEPLGRFSTKGFFGQRLTNEQSKNDAQSAQPAGMASQSHDGKGEKENEAKKPDNQTEKHEASSRLTAPKGGQTQFVAFIPAVPLERFQAAAAAPTSSASQNGQYHLIHPNGKLQRVMYMNQLGPNNRLTANVQYQDVDPIQGPLYTFGSPLVRVL